MAPRRCCVPSCTVAQGDGVPMHRFPNPCNPWNPDEVERFRTWVMRIGGDILSESDEAIHQNRRICHRHFEDVYKLSEKRLNRLAIPSLNIPGVLSRFHGQALAVNIPAPAAPQPSIPRASMQAGTETVHVSGRQEQEPANLAAIPLNLTGTVRDGRGQEQLVVGEPALSQHAAPKPSTSKASLKGRAFHRKSRISSNRMSKMERELRDTLAATKAKLKRYEKSKDILKVKLALARNITKTSAFEMLSQKMSPAAKIFFQMQIKEFGKRPRGRRFSLEEKILALSMYKPCPKAYKLLGNICILPKRKTLDKILEKVHLLPGINEILFHHLKMRVDKMPKHHRFCTLIFDEMAIAPHVNFDKHKDIVNGFVDNGTRRENKFCDHVLVFMVRGVIKKYKQPVSFTFCSGSTKTLDLKKQLETVLKKVTATGLNVISTVCDQGATNMAALNMLMNQTKENYLKDNKEYKAGFFELDGKKIYPIYDPPHLMKGIRNNLLTKDLEYEYDGRPRKAKWAHLEQLYRRGPGFMGVRLVHKLTANHVLPNLIPKMKVKFCTQVFSQSVGVAMGYMAGTGDLPKESQDTAILLMFFDKLFDSVNGSFSKSDRSEKYRCAVTPRSLHLKLWYKSLRVLKTMRFITKTGTKTLVPSITSWIKTIEAFQVVTKYLHSLGLNSLLLRHFNQDPLENFFGAIRAHGLRNNMPTACSFVSSYKSLLINNLTSPHSVGSNCEEDENNCLQSIKFFLTEDIAEPDFDEIVINEEHLSINLIDTENIIRSGSAMSKEKCAAIAYCSGWLVYMLKKDLFKNCVNCRLDLESENVEEFHEFIKLKEYKEGKTWLCYPTRQVFDIFCQVENITIEVLKTSSHMKRIREYIELVCSINLNVCFLTCNEHRDNLMRLMLRKSIVFFINNWCREINQILSGKTPFFNEDDPIKKQANDYRAKHKKGQSK